MRKFLQKIFKPFFTWFADKLAAAPDKIQVHESLSDLLRNIKEKPGKRGVVIDANLANEKFIIFSDHHKGNRDHGDDFAGNEPNYLAALEYYYQEKFSYINLGDSEELWKYSPDKVMGKNGNAFKAEAKFHDINKYYKTFGNHDLTWKNKIDVDIWFKNIFNLPLPVYEGIVINADANGKPYSIFLTHGHQGDKMSDNNAFSTWIVAHIWRPIQRYLQINVNTPAKDYRLRDKHNIMMYDWVSRKRNMLLITGHTHKPVFASGRYTNKEEANPRLAEKMALNAVKPSYFNSGCCCFNDGDITGIELANSLIILVKWKLDERGTSQRIVLEEAELCELVKHCLD